jgi:hypothetical protein
MTDTTDTSVILVKALIGASEDHAADCSSNAETHADLGNPAHAQAFTEMAAHHQRTAATLRALLAERDENEKAIAVWRGRTQRAEAERDRLRLVCLDARIGIDCAARLERTDARLAQEYRTKVATIDAALKETGHD